MNPEVIKYLFAGIAALACDILVLFLCTDVIGMHYLLSNVLGYSTGVVVSYFLNTRWVFANRVIENRHHEFLVFNIIVFVGLLISELMMYLQVELLALGYIWAKLYSSVVITVFNFIGKKVLLFYAKADESTENFMQESCCNCGEQQLQLLYTAPAFDGKYSPGRKSFQLVQCKNCEVPSTLMLDGEDVGLFYQPDYYGSGTGKFIALIENLLQGFAQKRAQQILSIYHQNSGSKKPRVIDIGCGRAILLKAMQQAGAGDVLGLERQQFPLDDSNKNIVRFGSTAELIAEQKTFDIAVMWHVLEHIESPDTMLDQLNTLLDQNGMLCLAVPNFGSLQQRLFAGHWFHLDIPRHLVHLDAAWLEQALEQRGFTIVYKNHFDLVQNTYGFIQSAMNMLFPFAPNAYYMALKHSQGFGIKRLSAIGLWSLIALPILPFAVCELLFSALANSGATIQFYAIKNSPANPGEGNKSA